MFICRTLEKSRTSMVYRFGDLSLRLHLSKKASDDGDGQSVFINNHCLIPKSEVAYLFVVCNIKGKSQLSICEHKKSGKTFTAELFTES